MNLKSFVEKLLEITTQVNASKTPVQMADTVSVVDPVLKDGVVFITDEPKQNLKN